MSFHIVCDSCTDLTEEDIKKYLGLHMLAAIPTEKRESI